MKYKFLSLNDTIQDGDEWIWVSDPQKRHVKMDSVFFNRQIGNYVESDVILKNGKFVGL